jgi:hypothetical protein
VQGSAFQSCVCVALQDRVLHTTTDLSVIEKNQMTFETFQKALPRIATEFYPTQPERPSTRGPSRMTRAKPSTEAARADSLMKLVTAQFDRSAALRSPRKEKVVIKRAWGAPPPPKKVYTLPAFLLLYGYRRFTVLEPAGAGGGGEARAQDAKRERGERRRRRAGVPHAADGAGAHGRRPASIAAAHPAAAAMHRQPHAFCVC